MDSSKRNVTFVPTKSRRLVKSTNTLHPAKKNRVFLTLSLHYVIHFLKIVIVEYGYKTYAKLFCLLK